MISPKADPQTAILLADSSPIQQTTIKGLLENFQLPNVTVVKDGYELIETTRQGSFGLILIDHGLAKANSTKTIANLRSEGKNAQTPIIFTYEKDDPHKEETLIKDAIAAGASAVLAKPVEEEPLREAIESLLRKYIVSLTELKRRSQESLRATEKAVMLATSLKESGELGRAESAYIEAILNTFYGLAELYLYNGDRVSADLVLREATHIDPKAREIFLRRGEDFIERGNEYLKAKRFQKAKMEFEAAIYLNDLNAAAIVGLGEALHGLWEREGALEAFHRALSAPARTEYRFAYKRIGDLAFKMKEYDLAIRAYDKAISFIKADPSLFYQQALVFTAQCKFPEALNRMNKSLSLDPDFTEGKRVREKILQWMKGAERHREHEAQPKL